MLIFMNILIKNLCVLHKLRKRVQLQSLRERMMKDGRYINTSAA